MDQTVDENSNSFQLNNIEFQDSTFRTIHLGQEAGNIEIGEYKANDKINVLDI